MNHKNINLQEYRHLKFFFIMLNNRFEFPTFKNILNQVDIIFFMKI